MNIEALIQNIITLFVVAIIMEAAIMAIFSLSSVRMVRAKRPLDATRDGLIIILSFFLSYKVEILSVFRKTGIALPRLLDIVITALVLARLTNLVWNFMSRMKGEE
jgi:hypothetical protein